jgi:CHASE3 domain sensor protein
MSKLFQGGASQLAAALLATLLLAVTPSPALATDLPDQLAQAQVDEPTMKAFVEAAKEVVALRQRYEPLLQKAETQEAAQKLVEEARGLMNAAITSSGMTVEEYTGIARAAQADPTLRARIEAAVGVQ